MTLCIRISPTSLNAAATQALVESDGNGLHVGNVDMNAAAVKHPFIVGKPGKVLDVNHFHFST